MNDLALFKKWLQTTHCQAAFEMWKMTPSRYTEKETFSEFENKHFTDYERSLGEKNKRFDDFSVVRPQPQKFGGGIFPQPPPEPSNIIPQPGGPMDEARKRQEFIEKAFGCTTNELQQEYTIKFNDIYEKKYTKNTEEGSTL